jgi:phosphotransferase system enzyme I (PtsI)
MVIDNGHKEGIMVGMCGEMAGDQLAIPLLLGLGLDEFSMSAASVLNARKLIRGLNYEKTQEIGNKVLAFSTSKDIKEYIGKCFK